MSQANDSILVTPGTGATVATHTANSKEHQVMMVADEAGHILGSKPTYWAFANGVAFANNKQMFSLFNGSGSGKIVKLHTLRFFNMQISPVTGVELEIEIKLITARSSGTTVTPAKVDSQNAALPSQIVAAHNSTVTEGAVLFSVMAVNEEISTTNNELIANTLRQLGNLLPHSEHTQPLTLREGEGITLKCITSTTLGQAGTFCAFTVE